MAKKLLALVLSVLMLVSLLPVSALAATYDVNDFTALQDKLDNAESNDVIRLGGIINIPAGSSLVFDHADYTIELDVGTYKIIGAADKAVIEVRNGTLKLVGTTGEITHAGSDEGAGVVVTGGSFIMEGGSVTGNKLTIGDAAGVVVSGGTFKAGKDAKVTGNTVGSDAANVYLPDGKTIEITEALTNNAAIGVTMAAPNVFTSGAAADCTANFTSDDDTFVIVASGNNAALGRTVTFNSNGGSAVTAQKVIYNGTATEPTGVTKTGHHITGWTLGGSAYDFSTVVTGNITLDAQWEENSYTVVYKPGEGGGTQQSNTYTFSQDPKVLGIEDTDFSKDGATFANWVDNANNVYNKNDSVVDALPNGGTLYLTAQWNNQLYSVTYYYNDSSNPDVYVTDSDTHQYGSPVNLKGLSALSWTPPANKKFSGWRLTPDAPGAIYEPGNQYNLTGNTPMYAVWVDEDAATVKVTYDFGDGTTTESDVTVNSTITMPTKTWDDYEIEGWYPNATFTPGEKITGAQTVTADTTFYAYRVGKDVNVTFHLNGGNIGGSTADPTATWKYGTYNSSKLPADPTKEGSNFQGWFTASTGGAGVDFANLEPGDREAHAQWATGSYTVTVVGTDKVTASPTSANKDTTITLTVNPGAGYELETLTVTNKTTMATIAPTMVDATHYTFGMPGANVEVTATFKQLGYTVTPGTMEHGSVTFDPVKAYYNAADVVTVTPVPADGYEFKTGTDTITVKNVGSGATGNTDIDQYGKFVMPANDVEVTATFTAKSYAIAYNGTNGSVTGKVGGATATTAATDSTVTLETTANEGYGLTLVKVYKTGDESTIVAQGATLASFTMPAYAVTVDATFAAGLQPIAISDSIANGSVGTDGNITQAATGADVTLTNTPDTGYEFVSYTVTAKEGGATVDVDSTGKFTMVAGGVDVTATFTQINYDVTLGAHDGGTLTIKVGDAAAVSDSTTAHYGDVIVLTPTAEGGKFVNSVTYTVEGDSAVTLSSPYNFTMPAKKVTVAAAFSDTVASYNGVEYSDFNEAFTDALTGNGTIELELLADVTLDGEKNIDSTKNVTLDLNGHGLTAKTAARAFTVKGTLTIKDSGADGYIAGNDVTSASGGIIAVTGIDDSNKAFFNLDGGTLKGATAKSGGAVYLTTYATFTMTGGKITNCAATENGGAVYVDENCTFDMKGGVIGGSDAEKNTATGNGGGVYVNGTFNAYAGTISYNSAVNGGGVYENKSHSTYLKVDTAHSLNGVTIENNTATDGAGVYVSSTGHLDMTGGIIRNNTATDNGAGVYNAGVFDLKGGTITGNAATGNGDGIYDGKTLKVEGAPSVKANDAEDIYIANAADKLVVTDALTNSDLLTITMQTPGQFTNSAAAGSVAEPSAYLDKFASGNAGYGVRKYDAKDLQLAKAITVTAVVSDPVNTTKILLTNTTAGGTAAESVYAIEHDSISVAVSDITEGYHLVSVVATPDGKSTLTGSGSAYTLEVDADTDDITVTATVAANTYKVHFEADGGEGTMPDQDFVYGTAQDLNDNAFTKTGYIFDGWTDGTNNYNDKANVNNLTTTDGATVNFTAVWKPITYTIKFEGQGASNTMEDKTGVKYDDHVILANSFTRAGYTMLGWARAADPTQVVYNIDQDVTGLTAINNGTVVLYSVWKADPQTIKINYNGGTAPSGIDTTHLSGDVYTTEYDTDYEIDLKNDPSFAPTLAGQRLDGWEVQGQTGTYTVSYKVPANGATLVAKWVPETSYTVTYESGDYSTGADVSETVLNGTSYTLKPATTFTSNNVNMEFSNWLLKGTTETFIAGNTVTITGDKTFIAQWTPVKHTVSFDPQNGSTVATQQVPHGAGATEPSPAPTKDYYDFDGWYNGTEKWDFSSYQVLNDVTLTGHWKAKDVKVTFKSGANGKVDGGTEKEVTWPYDGYADSYLPATTADDGYTFNNWWDAESGGNQLTATNFRTYIPGQSYTVWAHWSAGEYTIASETAGVMASETKASKNATIYINITAADGQQLVGKPKVYKQTANAYLAEDDVTEVTAGQQYKFTMPADNVIITGQFEAIGYKITLEMEHGTVKVYNNGVEVTDLASETFTVNDPIRLVPDAAAGYDFVTGTLEAYPGSSTTPLTLTHDSFNMPANNVKVKATFTAVAQPISLNFNSEGGTVTSDPTDSTDPLHPKQYTDADVVLTATAKSGYTLDTYYYTVGTDTTQHALDKNAATNTVKMPAGGINVYATFEAVKYEVAVTVDPADTGTVTINGNASPYNVATDAEVTLVNTPKDGYAFQGYVVTPGSVAVDADGKFTMPANDVAVTAKFYAINYDVQVNYLGVTVPDGTVAVAGDKNVGKPITLTVTASTKVLTKLTVAYATNHDSYIVKMDTVNPYNATFTTDFTMPADNVIVTATFADAVAQIGSTYYDTLDKAFDAALLATSAVEIDVLADTTLAAAKTIPADKDITLDLNGHAVDAKATGANVFTVADSNKAKFTIKDTNKTGYVVGADTATIVDVKESGKFTLSDAKLTGGKIGVNIVKTSSFTVSGDAIVTGNTQNVYVGTDATITVSGLGANASIGVTMQATAGGKFTDTFDGTNYTKFTSDDSEFTVKFVGSGSGYAALTKPYKITITENANGTITTDPKDYAVAHDTGTTSIVTVTVTPNDGYVITGVTYSYNGSDYQIGPASPTDSTYSNTFQMPGYDVTVAATFDTIKYTVYEISADTNNGNAVTADPNTNVTVGQLVKLTVTEAAGYHMVPGTLKYTDSNGTYDVGYDTTNGYNFNMPASDVTLTAQFELTTYSIYTVSADSDPKLVVTNGSASPATEGKMGDTIVVTPDMKSGYMLESITVTYGVGSDAVPFTTEYFTADNTFKSATFAMPAGDTTITAKWTKVADWTAVDAKLKTAATATITDRYYGVVMPEGATLKYYIQNTVDAYNTGARDADMTLYLTSLHDAANAYLLVYDAAPYTWDATSSKWTNPTKGALNTINTASGSAQFAVDGIPVTVTVIKQDYVVGFTGSSTTPLDSNGEIVAIYGEKLSGTDATTVANKFNKSKFGDFFEIDADSVHEFSVYVNNVKVGTDVQLKEKVNLKLDYAPATASSLLQVGTIHNSETKVFDTEETKNLGSAVTVWSDLFSPYIVANPKQVELEFVDIGTALKFVQPTGTIRYKTPFTFTLTLDTANGIEAKAVYANGYEVTPDTNGVYTVTPETLKVKITAEATVPVTYHSNYVGTGVAAADVTYKVDYDVEVAIEPGTIIKPESTAYSFLKWTSGQDSTTNEYVVGSKHKFTSKTDIYAQWTLAEKYNITFDANLDAGSDWEAEFVTPGAYTIVNDVDTSKLLGTIKPVFTRTNYKLVGWYTIPDMTDSDIESYKLDYTKALNDPETAARITAGGHKTPVAGEDGVFNVTLYAKWEPLYSATDTPTENDVEFVTGDEVKDGTFAVYYSDKIIAKNQPGSEPTYVTRRFITVGADNKTKVAPETVLPTGLHLNELTGEIYGVPTEICTDKEFTVRVVSDDGKLFFSAAKTFKISIGQLPLAIDYAIDASNTDAYKIFGDANPADGKGFKQSSYLTGITVNGKDVSGYKVADDTYVYATGDDTDTLKLEFRYSPTAAPYTISGNPAADYTFSSVTYNVKVQVKRVAGENAGSYKIYVVASDVEINNDATTTAAFDLTIANDFKSTADDTTGKYTFTIKPKDINLVTVAVNPKNYTYTGSEIEPKVTVTDKVAVNLETGAAEADYPVTLVDYKTAADTEMSRYGITCTNNINAGIANFTITGYGNYTGTKTGGTFTIDKKSIADPDVYVTAGDVEYAGYKVSPDTSTIIVKYMGKELVLSDNLGDFIVYNDPSATPATSGTNTHVAGNADVEGEVKDNYITIKANDSSQNFEGMRQVPFRITPKKLSIKTWDEVTSREYNGTDLARPTVTAFDDGNVAAADIGNVTVDKISYSYYDVTNDVDLGNVAPVNAGVYKVTADISLPDYTFTTTDNTRTYTITRKALTDAMVTVSPVSAYYTGSDVAPTVTVQDGAYTLKKDVDYTLVWKVSGSEAYVINADTYTATITGIGNYKDVVSPTFTVLPKPVTITMDSKSKVYGNATPEMTYTVSPDVVHGVDTLVVTPKWPGQDTVGEYDIDCDYTITNDATGADGSGNYAVTVVKGTYTIEAKTLSGATVKVEPKTLTFNNTDQKDSVNVSVYVTFPDTSTTKKLELGTDYYLVWNDTENAELKNAGDYTVKAIGKGNYKDYEIGSDTLTIEKAELTNLKVTMADWTEGSTASNPNVTGNSGNGTVTYQYKPQSEATYGSIKPSTQGSYTVKAIVAETANYKGGEATANFKINASSGGGGGTGGGGSIGGGSSGGKEYSLKLAATTDGTLSFNNKYITDNPHKFAAGTKVTIDVVPASYYRVERVTYSYTTDGKTVEKELTADANGAYILEMPSADTVVTATFVPKNNNDPSVGKITIENYTNGYVDCDHTDDNCPLAYFEDLKDNLDAWYHDGIHYCLENGIMQGFGTPFFLPDDYTTRAQVVTTLWNIAGNPIAKSDVVFDDVKEDDWFYDAIMWAAANHIVNGYGDGNFGPNDLITHEQVAKIFYGYAAFYGFDVTPTTDISGMPGANTVHEWALPYVQWGVATKLCCGVDGNVTLIAATANVTRAELATTILNFCTRVATKPAQQ